MLARTGKTQITVYNYSINSSIEKRINYLKHIQSSEFLGSDVL